MDNDGFLSKLSVELFSILPESLVLSKEVRPSGVSPESLCLGLDLLFLETLVLPISSSVFMPNFVLILLALAFLFYFPFVIPR